MDLIRLWHAGAQYARRRWSGRTWTALTALTGRSQAGNAFVEYALLVALIAMVCLLAVTYLGEQTSTRLSTVASAVQRA